MSAKDLTVNGSPIHHTTHRIIPYNSPDFYPKWYYQQMPRYVAQKELIFRFIPLRPSDVYMRR